MLEQTFGAWLRERRQALDLTRAELARQVGCAPVTLQKLEADQRRPSRQMAERLAYGLDIAAHDSEAFVAAARRGAAPAVAQAPFRPAPAAGTPFPLTPLIGREDDLQRLVGLLRLPQTRLITLVGPAGVGKTHLALYVARAARQSFSDGVVFVNLEHVRQPGQLLPVLGRSFDLAEADQASLVAALRDKHSLLVLDNFEQIVAAAPELAGLLRLCPALSALVTSRERLLVRGEQTFAVEPLAVPPAHADFDTIMDAPAVQLFAEVAALTGPFRIDAANAPDVAAICRLLDGLPLAIELLAAGVRHDPPAALLEQVRKALHLSTTGPRDLPDRQRTLRAALDWSYTMLDAAERASLLGMGVFVAGASPDQLAAVVRGANVDAAPATLRTLTALADKSLVQRVAPGDDTRWSLLETVRLYALEQLAAGGILETMRQDHAHTMLRFMQQAGQGLDGQHQDRWLRRLDLEYPNVLAAADWLVEHDLAAAAQLCNPLTRYWFFRGYLQQGQRYVARILARGDELPPLLQAKMLNANGTLTASLGNFEVAAASQQQSLVLYRSLDDATGISHALYNLGVSLMHLARYDAAEQVLQEALDRDRAGAGDEEIAVTLGTLANLYHFRADFARAWPLLEESLRLLRGSGDDHGIALTLTNIADIAMLHGDTHAARRYLDEALAISRSQGFARVALGALIRAADLALREGDEVESSALCREAVTLFEQVNDLYAGLSLVVCCARRAVYGCHWAVAATLLSAFTTLSRSNHVLLPPADLIDFEQCCAAARAGLDAAGYIVAEQRGGTMSIAEAVALAATVCA